VNVLSPDRAIALALVSGASGMLGVFLDTAWHRTIGRDSLFILPHLFIYAGGVGILFASACCMLRATRRGAEAFGGPIVRVERLACPFGFAAAALGVLTVIAAAPVDAWWHWMYGKDALIWSFSHLMGHFGAGLAAIGLLFAVAAQSGRGVFRRRWLWRAVMLVVFVDLVHRSLFVLAHYTMIPETRTPDFYPFLASLLLSMVLLGAVRSLDPWAPTIASLLFVALALVVDALLRAVAFERYTVTPLVFVPALGVTLLAWAAGRYRDRVWLSLVSGALFALTFTGMETLWMAHVVERPWAGSAFLPGLSRLLLTGALSGYVGWVLGGFLRAVQTRGGAVHVFGSAGRARSGALGLVSTYHPQRFGPPMTVEELALTPLDSFRYQEGIFWDVLLQDGWWQAPRLDARSEGIVDRFPLPIGPAWCARSEDALTADLARIRFALEVNGAPVELSRYPLVRLRHRDGARCAWVGVASRFQRASENRFVYVVDLAPRSRTVIDMRVVFKDP
jgi:hypothetical protein